MAGSMCMAAVFLIASSVVQADQCSSVGECNSTNEPQRVVSLLQTNLQMNAFEESVDDAKGGNMDTAPKAKAAAKKEGRSKAKPKAKKAEAKGMAKPKPKQEKQVELASANVLDSKSQWVSCTFNWTTLSHAHMASHIWGFIPDLKKQLLKRREDLELLEHQPQSLVPERLEPMLQVAASILDKLNVNWYLGFGAELGFLRSEAFIPWDEDVDLVVKKADRIHVCDFIKEGSETTVGVYGKLSAFRSVPDHPEWLMVAYYTSAYTCQKVLWIDIETELAIDMCIDCFDDISGKDIYVPTKSAFFGNVEVKVPEHPFHSSIIAPFHNYGIDKTERQIPMKTYSKGGWACKRYECGAEPPTVTSAASLEDVYSTSPSAMRGPFDFHVDISTSDHSTAQCSLPRNFDSCSAEEVGLKEVWVRPCQESPWASPPSLLVTPLTKQGKKYYAGPWMVEQLQTQ